MKLGRPNLEEFGATMLELGRANPDVLVCTSDSRGSGKLVPFGQALPEQIVELGIAEQNLIGVAAGLASAGKRVFAVVPACFLTTRALEQIKNDVCYSDHPVKLISISAGVSYGALGSTHHSLHDYAALRAIHNITIVAPADNHETRSAILAALDYPHPIYIRMGKRPMLELHQPNTPFEVGKAIMLRDGSDVTFVAIGEPVAEALLASQILAEEGIQCRVISMHTLKPLDQETLLAAATDTRVLITVEEHSIYGGLGGACAELLMERGVTVPFKIVGIPDEYTVTGSQMDIFRHYGITPEGLAETARQMLETVKV
ncbi:hypothetical protein FKZ61_010650 [Litorilinea aerophila]|uniref:Transketolase family protein n=1 Tax=Litorilinea aerophila TaxID=1204385 RepID=A0A540VGI3_9CHLR|nr:transketolase C-terminal domain-containing protein [Litorilinea aerophila]MCC9076568.1 hypothetical protein [Litorilinea aerophila]OUC05975.1 transketolase [Litorilinea aerophila]GIV79973.1 MAG: transketolase, C-terminal subunit [Litorilinea sp.]